MNGHQLIEKLQAMDSSELDCELFATFGNDENGNAFPIIVTDILLSGDLSINGLVGQIGGERMPVLILDDEKGTLDLVRTDELPKTWRGHIDPEGVYLNESLFANWPDTDGSNTIRVQDEHGSTVERVDRDSADPVEQARWNELRDLMPDDALYFQPEGAGDHDDDTLPESVRQLASYQVYRSHEAAVAAHPEAEITGYQFAEIENPKFLDVAEPKLYWNEDEDE